MRAILIDDLELEVPPNWTLYPMGQLILARSEAKVGSLQISRAFRHDLPRTASRTACRDLALRFVIRDGMNAPCDQVEFEDRTSLSGRFGYTVGEEVGSVWYRFTDGEFLIGVYACQKEEAQERLFGECEAIMKSARYRSSNEPNA